MQSVFPFSGEVLSLLTAVVWALAVTLFKRSGETVHPLALNAFKNILAILLLIPTILLLGHKLFLQTSAEVYFLLLLSGVLGIGIGDTLFFQSLNKLGAGLTGIVVCMYSPFIITFSHIWLNESLTYLQIFGVLLIIFAVLFSTLHKTSRHTMPTRPLLGIVYGVLASAAMAGGVILMKPFLSTHPVIWVAEIRLLGGMIALAIIFLAYRGRRRILNSLFKAGHRGYTLSGSFLGAYVSMLLWIGGMKYTQASIASALNQTSTLFIFIFAGLLLQEPINARRAIGIATAFIGAFVVSVF